MKLYAEEIDNPVSIVEGKVYQRLLPTTLQCGIQIKGNKNRCKRMLPERIYSKVTGPLSGRRIS